MALDSSTAHLSTDQREAMARDAIMKTLAGEEQEPKSREVEDLEKEKGELEEALNFYNGQLKEIVDDTRQLINDVNSLQFYS